MAKETGTTKVRNIVYLIMAVLAMASMFGKVVYTWASHNNTVSNQATATETAKTAVTTAIGTIKEDAAALKKDGCKPSGKK